MQQTQENCFLALAFLVLGTVLAPALATAEGAADPLLSEVKGACDPRLDGPDYIAGTDASGNPVASADLPDRKVPTPDGILVPLAGGHHRRGGASSAQAYAELNQKDVDGVLDPAPACPPARNRNRHASPAIDPRHAPMIKK